MSASPTPITIHPSSNATQHGGTSKQLIIPGENPAHFESLLNDLLEDHQPTTAQHHDFIENVATAQWFLFRRQRACNAIEAAVYENEPNPANWTEQHLKRLALADRYKTQAERSLKRALHNLDGLQKWERGETNLETRRAQWQAEQQLRERRMALQEQKFELAKMRHEARAAATAKRSFRFAKNAVSSPPVAKQNHPATENGTALTHETASQSQPNRANAA